MGAKVPAENAPIQENVILPKVDDLTALYVEERTLLKQALEEQQRLSRPLVLSVDTLFGPESPSLENVGAFEELLSADLTKMCEKDEDMESDDGADSDESGDDDMEDGEDEDEDSESGDGEGEEDDDKMDVDVVETKVEEEKPCVDVKVEEAKEEKPSEEAK